MDKKINKEIDLIQYECPFFAELISIGFLQNIMAKWIAHRVKVKYYRYKKREARKELFKNKTI